MESTRMIVMRKIIAALQVSLDGLIEGPNEEEAAVSLSYGLYDLPFAAWFASGRRG
jgi:hypothetical protein